MRWKTESGGLVDGEDAAVAELDRPAAGEAAEGDGVAVDVERGAGGDGKVGSRGMSPSWNLSFNSPRVTTVLPV
jgi:hypothetical protein